MTKNETFNSHINEHPHDLLPAYSLGILDVEEAAQVQMHLAGCKSCRVELASYEQVVGALALPVVEVDPPQELKNRLIGQVEKAPPPPVKTSVNSRPAARERRAGLLERLKRTAPAWGTVSFVAALFLLGFSMLLVRGAATTETTALRVINLNADEFAPKATGVMVISEDGEHGTLVVDRLPYLEEDQQYQLWLVSDGERTSGGVFSVSREGYGSMWVKAPLPLASYQGCGITIEPAGGSPGPTGPRVLRAEIE